MRGMIIGGGIGGLSTAIALRMRGITVQVFEAARLLAPVGAGILVPPNAMAIMRRYNLSQKIQESGHALETLAVVDSRGRAISNTPAVYSNGGNSDRTVAIHRGALQHILADALEPGVVVTGYDCVRVQRARQGVEAIFQDGSKQAGSFVIGADGIHSTVRASLFPEARLRYSGQLCWRGIAAVTLSAKWRAQLTEAWGNGLRFGFVHINPELVYWYATQRAEQDPRGDDRDGITGRLRTLYGHFFDPVHDILARTETASIRQDYLYDLAPLRSWFAHTILLIGDAAHASTPNLGQGGAQAIEDSWVLAEKMAAGHSIHDAFAHFEAARVARANRIVTLSWRIGTLANLSNRTACGIRNAVMRCIPACLAKRQSRWLYDVSYATEA